MATTPTPISRTCSRDCQRSVPVRSPNCCRIAGSYPTITTRLIINHDRLLAVNMGSPRAYERRSICALNEKPSLPPCVRLVVAFDSSMANCPATSFHDQNTAFASFSRVQGAGTAQSQASWHALRYQRCRRAQYVRRHAQEVAAKRKQESRHDSQCGARCCCTGWFGVGLDARTAFDGAAAKLCTGRHGPGPLVPRAWRVRASTVAVAPGVLYAGRAGCLTRGLWRVS